MSTGLTISVQVIEMIPPHVQTSLQGERVVDPPAMPLDEHLAETMSLLQSRPEADDVWRI
ncbi:hypothetical protein AFA91_13830 [Mycolicibacterium goodii]|uniref:Uncharacterized protein n=1 Tax=Mycolicibacterium goodii TaxID=134601 RepID=A0A0K0X5U9_MYCGD|nr:hypothetical protein AFA91_13830 [Mycolicibacterium goodii]